MSKLKSTINQIDEKERKALFDTFVQKGGKIIDPQKKTNLPLDRKKKGGTSSKNSRPPASKNSVAGKFSLSKGPSELIKEFQENDLVRREVLRAKGNRRSDWDSWHMILKRISAYFQGITNLSGKAITSSFCHETHSILQEVLGGLKVATSFILQSPLFRRYDLIKSFSETYPIFTEVILRINALNFDSVVGKFSPSRDISLLEAKNYYLVVIRNFFPFWGRAQLVSSAFEYAFQFLRKLPNFPLENLEKQEKLVKRSVQKIFSEYLQRLGLLYPLLLGRNVNVISPDSKDILEIVVSSFLGSWGPSIQKNVDSFKKEEDGNSEDAAGGELQEETRNMLDMIYKLHFSEKDIPVDISTYERNDKIFVLFSILSYGVAEFGILDNHKFVSYRSAQKRGLNFSLERIVHEFFLNMDKFGLSVKNYTAILFKLNSFSHNLRGNTARDPLYIMTKEEENLTRMRDKMAYQLCEQAKEFISTVLTSIEPYIEEINLSLTDPDGTIQFPVIAFQSRTVTSTPLALVRDFYYFLKTCHYLLERGDLSAGKSLVPSDSPLLNLYE